MVYRSSSRPRRRGERKHTHFGWRAPLWGKPGTMGELASHFKDEDIGPDTFRTPFFYVPRPLDNYELGNILRIIANHRTHGDRMVCAAAYVLSDLDIIEATDVVKSTLMDLKTNGGSQITIAALQIAFDSLKKAEFANKLLPEDQQLTKLMELYTSGTAEQRKIARLVMKRTGVDFENYDGYWPPVMLDALDSLDDIRPCFSELVITKPLPSSFDPKLDMEPLADAEKHLLIDLIANSLDDIRMCAAAYVAVKLGIISALDVIEEQGYEMFYDNIYLPITARVFELTYDALSAIKKSGDAYGMSLLGQRQMLAAMCCSSIPGESTIARIVADETRIDLQLTKAKE